MRSATIVGMFVGGVESFNAPDGHPLTTGIRKKQIDQIRIETSGLRGDASADAEHHTRDRAIHLVSAEYYPLVENRLGVSLPRPEFGENLTTLGAADEEICVGDQLQIGSSLICVTQPTERCKVIGRSLGQPRILKALHDLEICRFYARVLETGEVCLGDTISLRHRSQGEWTIKRLHNFMFRQITDSRMADEVMRLPALSAEWKRRVQVMRGRSARGEPLSSNLVEL